MGVAYAVRGGRRGLHDVFGENFQRTEQNKDLTTCPIEKKLRGEKDAISPRTSVIRQDVVGLYVNDATEAGKWFATINCMGISCWRLHG